MMSGLNGVHALLAFLAQQAQSPKASQTAKIDIKQLDSLLQESRLLNERLLKIETLLSIPRTKDAAILELELKSNAKTEASWPAASLVRDIINSQERQRAFGFKQSEKELALDVEPYSYREFADRQRHVDDDIKQLLIQRYVPNEADQEFSRRGVNFGLHREAGDHFSTSENETGRESGRLLLLSVGFSLLVLTLFAIIS